MPFIGSFARCTWWCLERGDIKEAQNDIDVHARFLVEALELSMESSYCLCVTIVMMTGMVKMVLPLLEPLLQGEQADEEAKDKEQQKWSEWFQSLWEKAQ